MLDILSYVLGILGKIPDTIWAAITASLITLTGVWLTTRSSRKQQKLVLNHDASMRDKERTMSLRREIFLPAIEAISNSVSLLTKQMNLAIDTETFSDGFYKYSATIAKLQVVGSNETVQCIAKFSNNFGAVYMEVLLRRSVVITLKTQVEIQQKWMNYYSDEVTKFIEMMKQYNLNTENNPVRWAAIESQMEFARTQRDQYNDRAQKLMAEQGKKYNEFARFCFQKFTEAARLVPPVIFAMRTELELPIDEDKYMKSFNESMESTNAVLTKFLSDLDKQFNAQH